MEGKILRTWNVSRAGQQSHEGIGAQVSWEKLELRLFSLEKKRLRGDLMALCNCLEGGLVRWELASAPR